MIYSWIFVSFFILTPTLLFSAEVNLPTQKDVKEALQTVGRFLKEGSGPNWLSGLVTKQAAPLTTEQLVKEIINSTVATENVKQAANILKFALEEHKQAGANSTQVFEFDGWKDLIDNIEEQNDIVCLYRKSSNVSNERTQDWEKFLKNISPEYTIYLALEMGQKYVICLKKINVPERNNSDSTNGTIFNSVDSSKGNLSITNDNVGGNGSRSLNYGDKEYYTDNDKCDSPEMETINNQRNMPTKPNHLQRTLSMMPMPYPSKPDSPCNRPIIFMLPPNYVPPNQVPLNYVPPTHPPPYFIPSNYMPPIGGGNMPVWSQTGYQMRPPLMPHYPPNITPNTRASPSLLQYLNSNDILRRVHDYGRKRLPVTPRPFHSTESQDERNRVNPNPYTYGRNALINSPEISPGPIIHGVQLPLPPPPLTPSSPPSSPPVARYVLQQPFVGPLSRSLSPPWIPAHPFDHGYRQPNFMFYPYLMPPQSASFRPHFHNYQPITTPAPVSFSPSSSASSPISPNCLSCASLCDRPILVKVSVENPTNGPVKLHAPSRESMGGRRQMNEQTVENIKDNLNENHGESTVKSGDKEIG